MKTPFVFAIVLALAAWLSSTSAIADPVLHETFDDDSMDASLWAPYIGSQGPWLNELNGKLVTIIPYGCIPVNRNDDMFTAGYRCVRKLVGDFDIEVNYQLLCWPPGNGVRLGLCLTTDDGRIPSIQRDSVGERELGSGQVEAYVSDYGGYGNGHPTLDRSGTLCLVREGSVLTSYYWDNKDCTWVEVYSGDVSAEPAEVKIGIWSHTWAYAGWDYVAVAFDDFVISRGTLTAAPDITFDSAVKETFGW